MIVHPVDPERPSPEAISAAANAIRRGELVIFPTETVYGLAADARNEQAVRRLIEAKGRDGDHALPVQVASVGQLGLVAAQTSAMAKLMAARFWPGPLTLVMPKSRDLPNVVTAGKGTVGVRVPDHPVALALLREVGIPIVATSANVTGHAPPTTAEKAVDEVGEAVSVVLDAGPCEIGVPSTVVDASVIPPRVLRLGAISIEKLREVLGEVEASED